MSPTREPLLLYPAIDIRDGRCVRLLRGDYAAETVFGDPLEQARAYVEAGAPALHVVDLDAARSGVRVNRSVVAAIIERAPVPVQVGGGVRSAEAAEQLLGEGASRVVLGTAGVEDPDLTRSLAMAHPDRIVLGLDHRVLGDGPGARREIAVRGWERESGVELLEAVEAVADLPLAGLVVTEISRDGTLAGPDLEGYASLLGMTALPIVASGGVGSAADLRALAALEWGDRQLAGVIVGRALLDGTLSLKEALEACVR